MASDLSNRINEKKIPQLFSLQRIFDKRGMNQT